MVLLAPNFFARIEINKLVSSEDVTAISKSQESTFALSSILIDFASPTMVYTSIWDATY